MYEIHWILTGTKLCDMYGNTTLMTKIETSLNYKIISVTRKLKLKYKNVYKCIEPAYTTVI